MPASVLHLLESVVKKNEEQTKKVKEIDKKHQDYILNLEHVIHHTNSETKRYLEARIARLENTMSQLISIHSKKPYRCPICDGIRTCHDRNSGLSLQCVSCEGKGIVWG